jgi:hypothetical protein
MTRSAIVLADSWPLKTRAGHVGLVGRGAAQPIFEQDHGGPLFP